MWAGSNPREPDRGGAAAAPGPGRSAAQNQVTQAERVAKLLFEAGAGAFKDAEQAESDLRSAQHDLQWVEGQLEAARNRVRAKQSPRPSLGLDNRVAPLERG